MSVRIVLPGYLGMFTGGHEVVEVNGSTIGECLEHLVGQFPEIENKIFAKSGKLHGYVSIFVNDEDAYPGELTRVINSGDELAILYLLGGG